MSTLFATLDEFGAAPQGLRSFDEDAPELLPYATLMDARLAGEDSELDALRGVYEWQDSPLVFLIDGDRLTDEEHLRRIRRVVALRGDAPYLGVVRPGRLVLYRVGLDASSTEESLMAALPAREKRATFAWLGNQRPEADIHKQRGDRISAVVLKLLGEAIQALMDSGAGIERREDALSLAGRALFARFLGDRGLIPQRLQPVETLFDDAQRAWQTSEWLDQTFNGNFLPLDESIFDRLTEDACKALGHIMRRAPHGQLHLGWRQAWDFLDFAHIPVGVLSQAYEQHLRAFAPEQQSKEGVFYTPPVIADWMVRGAFHALRAEQRAHTARVLDPAAGAGVFLLAVFRQLVAERWAVDGVRPDTATLRQILYRQLVGFDINEAALRFAALGLYLMSIELDPHPRPVTKLRFKDLRGTVLHKVSGDVADAQVSDVGSLGSAVGAEHDGCYDLVIGNPPWSSGTKLSSWSEVKAMVAEVAKERLAEDASAPPLPSEGLDLPFVWRAMKWARPGGQIALAVGAGLLFQQGEGMPAARRALFQALDVTGVVNGTALRDTQLWPNSRSPFCLLFARNRRPPIGSGFRFVSPQLEEGLNNAGSLRVDAHNAEVVDWRQIAERPTILKVLFRGSRLDLELIERMQSSEMTALHDYWGTLFGWHRNKPRQTGNGYQKLRASSEIQKGGDGLPGVSADYLVDLPELADRAMETALVDTSMLSPLSVSRLHRRRPRDLFREPLLLVHQSPPADAGRVRTAVSDHDVVFNESYYGYSAHGHEDGRLLTRYLALLIGSRPALWHLLMTSGKFGFEREVVEKQTVDQMPVIPLDKLKPAQRKRINPLFDALVRNDTERNWQKVDAWAASVYGLDESDLQIIEDTLAYNLPFAANKTASQAPASPEQVQAFCDRLARDLAPWSADVSVHPVPLSEHWPWRLLCVQATPASSRGDDTQLTDDDWGEVLRVADQLAATEVLVPDPSNSRLFVARLRQSRYFSQSQARLVARQIVWDHPELLTSGKST